nr:immunoglobulin light chain junction region [Macaca mulatta]
CLQYSSSLPLTF